MDNISRESNSNYLPIAAIIVGVAAIALSIVALAKTNGVTAKIDAQIEPIASKVQGLDEQVRSSTIASENSSKSVTSLQRSTQDAFSQVAQALTSMREDIAKVQELAAKPAPAKTGGSTTPAVAGPDEYIVKGGDTGVKIASANGVSLADLLAVNPGVSWNALKVGQKLKLPAKK